MLSQQIQSNATRHGWDNILVKVHSVKEDTVMIACEGLKGEDPKIKEKSMLTFVTLRTIIKLVGNFLFYLYIHISCMQSALQ